MDSLGHVLYYTGAGLAVIALIWSFVVVFRENPVLGVVCLFIPFGLIVALVRWWPRTWRPLGLWVFGFVLFFCGLALSSPGR
jgi:hypothetical protein